jgi:hypothetical protein
MGNYFNRGFAVAIRDFPVGHEISNAQITAAFGGSRYRALRVSEEKKTIVVLANYANPNYVNHWEGNVLHFSAFEHGSVDQQDMEYYPNRRLHNSKADGYRVLLFERYPKRQNYTFRGEVEVRGVEARPTAGDLTKRRRRNLSFLLHPIRHHLTGEHAKILNLKLAIYNEDDYWTSYLLGQAPHLNPEEIGHRRDGDIIGSLWRAYASEVIEIFLADVELLAPNVLIPEYELERGSIKTVLPVLAAMAGIAGGTMSTVANYPKAKESLPIIRHDAQAAIKAAVNALEKKFPGVLILLESEADTAPHRQPNNQTFGPPLVRRKEEIIWQTFPPKET